MDVTSPALHRLKVAIAKAAGRWPAGAPGQKGGQFAPKGTSGAGGGMPSIPAFLRRKPSQGVAGAFPGEINAPQFGIFPASTKPAGPPPGSVPHPKTDDGGAIVHVKTPTKPSGPETWKNPDAVATFAPGSATPKSMGGVAMKKWTPPADLDGWSKVAGQNPHLDAVPFTPNRDKNVGAGVIIQEEDGRVWITKPTNHFGGYRHTFPKGTVEGGLSLQASAIKEAWEETGLKVQITGIVGDVERSTSKARYFLARRVGGTPSDMGWESQALRLVQPKSLSEFLNVDVDRDLARAILPRRLAKVLERWRRVEKYDPNQPRWKAGTPLGGQWKTYKGTLAMPPKIAGGLEGKNTSYQKAANAAFAAAEAGDWKTVADFKAKMDAKIAAAQAKIAAMPPGAKVPTHDKLWNPQLHQYVTALIDDKAAMPLVNATVAAITGPLSLSTLTYDSIKPGGSASGAVYADAGGVKYLVKGYAGDDKKAASEVIAAKIYEALGVNVPAMQTIALEGKHGGGLGVASKMLDEPLAPSSKLTASQLVEAQRGFAAHVLVNNYDAVGLTFDNLMVGAKSGKVYMVDPGGSFQYKATSGTKDFTGKVDLWDTMRNPGINPNGAKVFGSMTASQLVESAKTLDKLDAATVVKIVNAHHPGTDAEKAALANTILARRDAILAKTGALAPKAPPPAEIKTAPAAPTAPAPAAPKPPKFPPKLIGYTTWAAGINKMMEAGDAAKLTKEIGFLGGLYHNMSRNDADYGPTGKLLTFAEDALAHVERAAKASAAKPAAASKIESKQPVYTGADAANFVSATLQFNTNLAAPVGSKQHDSALKMAQIMAAVKDHASASDNSKAFAAYVMAAVAAQAPAASTKPARITVTFKDGGSKEYFGGLKKKFDDAVAAGDLAYANKVAGLWANKSAAKTGQPGKYANTHAFAKYTKSVLDAHGKAAAATEKPKTPRAGKITLPPPAVKPPAAAPKHDGFHGAGWKVEENKFSAAVALGDSKALAMQIPAVFNIMTAKPGDEFTRQDVADATKLMGKINDTIGKEKVAAIIADHIKEHGPKAPVVTGETAKKFVAYAAKAIKESNVDWLLSAKDHWSRSKTPEGKAVYQYMAGAAAYAQNIAANAAAVKTSAATIDQPTAKVAQTAGFKPAMPNHESYKFDPTKNTNAGGHNNKIDAIKNLADSKDVNAILSMAYATNSMGKKQVKYANDVLAALGSPFTVEKGQKKGAHPALGGSQSVASVAASAKSDVAEGAKLKGKFDPSKLPANLDYANWHGPGKPLSSKPELNADNQAVANKIYDLAKSGDLKALAAFTGHEGKSKYLGTFKQSLEDSIYSMLNPPEPFKITNVKQSTLASAPADFPPHPIGQNPKTLAHSDKVGWYVALGKTTADIASKWTDTDSQPSAEWKKEAYSAFTKLSPAATAGVRSIQGSAFPWRESLAAGGHSKVGSSSHTGLEIAAAWHKEAADVPAGVKLYRYFTMSAEEQKKMLTVEAGSVLSSLSATPASHNNGGYNTTFGPNKLELIAAPGAKAMRSFGSGGFQSEMETSLLPNHRFVVVRVRKRKNGGVKIKGYLLPP